ncbi:MAG: hypothetical protein ABEJ78_02755 [Haloferacaceae archaeon]
MNVGKFFAGLTFRTNTPDYAAGDELVAFVTGYDDEGAVVRIGDTELHLPDAEDGLVDAEVLLRVTEFDADAHEGYGTMLDVRKRP